MLIDIARRYWQLTSLQTLADDIAAAGGTFLHLHLSDDENYGIESTVLGQTEADSTQGADGVWTNPRTGKPFLSFDQLRTLDSYAAARGVELVLEVDAPGHMQGIRNLLKTEPKWATSLRHIFSADDADELNLSSREAWRLVLALDAEVAGVTAHPRHQHLGGDEFSRPPAGDSRFAGFVTARARALERRGITAQLWNDSITPMTLAELPAGLEITYWNYHDFTEDEDDADERVTAPRVLAAGFHVLNYCGYYLYAVPGGKGDTAGSRAESVDALRSDWTLGTWAEGRTTSAPGIIGAAVSVWGEDAKTLSDKEIIARSLPLFTALTAVVAHR